LTLSTRFPAHVPTESGFAGGPPHVVLMIADGESNDVWVYVVHGGSFELWDREVPMVDWLMAE